MFLTLWACARALQRSDKRAMSRAPACDVLDSSVVFLTPSAPLPLPPGSCDVPDSSVVFLTAKSSDKRGKSSCLPAAVDGLAAALPVAPGALGVHSRRGIAAVDGLAAALPVAPGTLGVHSRRGIAAVDGLAAALPVSCS